MPRTFTHSIEGFALRMQQAQRSRAPVELVEDTAEARQKQPALNAKCGWLKRGIDLVLRPRGGRWVYLRRGSRVSESTLSTGTTS